MLSQWWRRLREFVRRRAQFYHAGLASPASILTLDKIRARRDELERLPDAELRSLRPECREDAFALAAVACHRVLDLTPHDVQIQGALAMSDGRIAEMQ